MTAELTEIVAPEVDEVDLVKNAANGTAFLIAKSAAEKLAKARESTAEQNDLPDSDFAYIEPGGTKDDEGKTVPRSLRHFPINDPAHVRNALARASQSPFGDKAMPKIREAAKKFGIDVAKASQPKTIPVGTHVTWHYRGAIGHGTIEGVHKMGTTSGDTEYSIREHDHHVSDSGSKEKPVVYHYGSALTRDDSVAKAADETDSDEPGSRAWEQMDAALAQQMIDTLVGLRAKLKEACEREQAEVDAGDVDDADDVEDLGDVDCALDCALTLLARFLVNEEAEAKEPDDADESEKDEPESEDEQVTKTALTAEQVQTMITANNEQVIAAIRESLTKASDDTREIPGTNTVVAPADDESDDDEPKDEPDDDVAKATPDLTEVIKGTITEALKAAIGEQEAVVKAALAPLEERLAKIEQTPDDRRSPLLSGATGTAGVVRRDGATDGRLAELAKAAKEASDPLAKREAQQTLAYEAIRARFQ